MDKKLTIKLFLSGISLRCQPIFAQKKWTQSRALGKALLTDQLPQHRPGVIAKAS
jgi:hypothetical protein